MSNSYTDHKGRPIVVVTGMGVVTSLGKGKNRKLDSPDGRQIRHQESRAVSRPMA